MPDACQRGKRLKVKMSSEKKQKEDEYFRQMRECANNIIYRNIQIIYDGYYSRLKSIEMDVENIIDIIEKIRQINGINDSSRFSS